MGMFKEALEDFQQVKKIHPNDPDAPNKLKECEKVVLKLRFEEAIALPDSQRHSITNSIKFCSTGVKGDAILPTRGKMCDTCKGEKITKHEHLLTSTSPADGVANVLSFAITVSKWATQQPRKMQYLGHITNSRHKSKLHPESDETDLYL
ncbi:hypothetical protein LguiA_029178 [Lonicera macranthoides]